MLQYTNSAYVGVQEMHASSSTLVATGRSITEVFTYSISIARSGPRICLVSVSGLSNPSQLWQLWLQPLAIQPPFLPRQPTGEVNRYILSDALVGNHSVLVWSVTIPFSSGRWVYILVGGHAVGMQGV